jgi:hypothetical protein
MRVRGGWWSRYGHSRLGSGSPGRCGAGRLLYSIRQSWTSTRASRRVLKASTASSSSRRRPPKLSTAELQDLLVAPRRVGGGCVSHGAMIPLPSRRRGAGSHNLQLPTWLPVLASDPLPLRHLTVTTSSALFSMSLQRRARETALLRPLRCQHPQKRRSAWPEGRDC